MAEDEELIACDRSPSGMPLNLLIAEIEDSTAKDFRKETIRLWEENLQIYQSHAKDLGFTPFVTEDLHTRLGRMQKYGEYAGEPEIIALTHVVKQPIIVYFHNAPRNRATKFGDVYDSTATAIEIFCYPDMTDGPGPYDLLISQPTTVYKPNHHVAIRAGATKWYMGAVTKVVEVKFMRKISERKFVFSEEPESWIKIEDSINEGSHLLLEGYIMNSCMNTLPQ